MIGAPLSGFWTAIRAPVVSASSMIMLMVLLKLFFVPRNVSPLIEVMVIGSCGFVLYGLILKTVFGQSWKPILDLVRPAS